MLKTKHFFPFIKMIKALDVKEELKSFYQKIKGKTEDELSKLDESGEGFDFLYIFIEKLPNAEKEVMGFLSLYLEKPLDEIQEMHITEMFSTMAELFQDPNFKNFFQQVMK